MSPLRSVRLFVSLAFIVSFMLPLNPVVAQDDQPAVVDKAQIQALLTKAQTDGSVRVIVGLRLPRPFRPEGELKQSAIEAQRQAIQAAQQALIDSLAPYRPEVYARFQFIPYLALRADESTLRAMVGSPLVTGITEDAPLPPLLESSIPIIGADNVWEAGYEGAGWAVAVLDTGVQWDHSFFGGSAASRVVSEACYSNAGGGGAGVTLCPNGLASQTTGHASDPTTANCLDGGTNICTHGTHVAGIVAGSGTAYSGVAKSASLIGVQVFTRFNSDATCGVGQSPCVLSYISDQILGLQRVYDLRGSYNIAAVNMSLGGGKYTDAQQALCDSDNASTKAVIDTLRSVGIATIIASGNDGYTDGISAPGCISTAIGVGATTDADTVASFSNSSNLVDLLAPGVSIDSSIPPNTFDNYQGTSMATPHVAGAWALLKSVAPTATIDNVLAALQSTGVPVTDTRNGVTKRRIQVDAAAAASTPATWLGNTSSWNTASNWSTNQMPSRITNVTIPASPSGGNFPMVDANAAVYDLTIADGARITMTTPYTFNVSGNWIVLGGGAFNAATGTVVFRGDRPQTITMTNNADDHFHHLQIGDGGTGQTVSLGSDLNVDGDLTIKAGATLAGGNRTINVGGDWQEDLVGFSAQTSSVVFNGPTHSLNRQITTTTVITQNFTDYDGYPNGSFTNGAPAGWTTAQYGNGTPGYNTWWFGNYAGGPNQSPYSGGFALRWRDGTATTIDAWLFSPPLSLRSGVLYQLQFRYGVFSAGDPQTISAHLGSGPSSSSMTTQLVNLANASNTSWLTSTTTFTVAVDGTYYLGFRDYDASANTYGAGLDNISLSGAADLTFYDLSVTGSSQATLSGHTVIQHNLNVNAGSTLDLDTHSLTVDGTLTNNGTLRQTKNVAGPTEFLHIQNAAGTVDKYFGVNITPTSTALQTTTVEIKGNQTGGCTTNPADALLFRCFTITPLSAQSADIRFYYTEAERNGQIANALKLWHYNGPPPSWVQVGAPYLYSESGATCTTAGGTACWLQATAVSTYSPFSIGSGVSAPLAVRVAALSGASYRASGWLIAGATGLIVSALGGLYLIRRRTPRR